jgi:hypothetical protein
MVIIIAAAVALSAGSLAPRPAAACVSFDFDAELAAVDQALANAKLSPEVAVAIAELRNKAAEIDQQATHLGEELGELETKRNLTILEALTKLHLMPIFLPSNPPDERRSRRGHSIARC